MVLITTRLVKWKLFNCMNIFFNIFRWKYVLEYMCVYSRSTHCILLLHCSENAALFLLNLISERFDKKIKVFLICFVKCTV